VGSMGDAGKAGRGPRSASAAGTASPVAISFVSIQDVAELQRANTQLQQLVLEQRAMLDNDMIGMVKLRDRRVVWTNRALRRIFGYDADQLLGQTVRALYPDDNSYLAFVATSYPVLIAEGHYRAQIEMIRKDERRIWIDASGEYLSPEHHECLWMLVDITAIKQAHEKIEHIAYHDVLTGLANRELLQTRLKQSLAMAAQTLQKVAVCYLDLDGFKSINDKFGHGAGDELLKQAAERLLTCVRGNDTVCRFGGDEFVLVLANLTDNEECEAIVNRILAKVNTPFALNNEAVVEVSASVGVALYPDDSTNKELLIRQADHAMYRAKLLGRNRLAHFSR
jgi:diguanylate cyclase (GGDEF)-like protein/PAS domain S-box-containing protein